MRTNSFVVLLVVLLCLVKISYGDDCFYYSCESCAEAGCVWCTNQWKITSDGLCQTELFTAKDTCTFDETGYTTKMQCKVPALIFSSLTMGIGVIICGVMFLIVNLKRKSKLMEINSRLLSITCGYCNHPVHHGSRYCSTIVKNNHKSCSCSMDCGSNTCHKNQQLCNTRFYQSASATSSSSAGYATATATATVRVTNYCQCSICSCGDCKESIDCGCAKCDCEACKLQEKMKYLGIVTLVLIFLLFGLNLGLYATAAGPPIVSIITWAVVPFCAIVVCCCSYFGGPKKPPHKYSTWRY